MSLREQYRKGLKPLVVEEWVDLLLYRPLGFLVALPIFPTPITPNMVTALSGLVGLAGAAYMMVGSREALTIGAALYMLSNVLDCTDGQLARMKNQFSRYGRIFDGVADYVVGFGTFLALFISWKPVGYGWTFWAFLVFFGGIVSTTFQGMHLNHVRLSYLKAIEHDANGKSRPRVSARERKAAREKRSIYRRLFLLPFYGLYRFYLSQERGVRRRVRLPQDLPKSEQKRLSLHMVLILWTFTGKGTHVTILALFLLLGRPEQYLWFTLIIGNLYVFAVYLVHKLVIRSLNRAKELRSDERSDSGGRAIDPDGGTHTQSAQDAARRRRAPDTELDA